jgi:ABC-type bacteriocin/lantibiotic exporter with double-glycine peptidase domain
VAGFKAAFGWAVFLGVLLVIPGLVLPWLLGRFVDEVLVTHMDGVAAPLLSGLLIAAVARSFLLAIQATLLMDTFGRAARVWAKRFVAQALSLPMTFYSQRSPGEIAARVDLNERVAETISSDLATVALQVFTASFFLILMVRMNAGLALVVSGCVASSSSRGARSRGAPPRSRRSSPCRRASSRVWPPARSPTSRASRRAGRRRRCCASGWECRSST